MTAAAHVLAQTVHDVFDAALVLAAIRKDSIALTNITTGADKKTPIKDITTEVQSLVKQFGKAHVVFDIT